MKKLLRIISILTLLFLTVIAVPSTTAGAEPTETTATSADAKDVVTCTGNASDPIVTGGNVRGEGRFISCVPHAPDSCSVQATLQVLSNGVWLDTAIGPDSRTCPPTTAKSIASTECVDSTALRSFRTKVELIIVEDG